MPDYPSGTIAFLFTDIEGSTKRWERDAAGMWLAVERHFILLKTAITAQNGVLFKTIGDAVQAAFPTAAAAVAAAVDALNALREENWGDLGPLRVRMAIHVGNATPKDGDYLAPSLNRLARLLGTGYGEQVLLTEAARASVEGALPTGYELLDLGSHRLRDLLQPEHIYQLVGPDLVAEFPPLKSLDRHLHNLPAQLTALLGREDQVAEARALLAEDGVRIVTLTGPGGTGKTRLGMQIGAELVQEFIDGVWFVPLAAVANLDLVVPAIAQALGIREVAGEPLMTTLQDYLRAKHALLLLDNFEHLTAAAPTISSLLAACSRIQVLITSREPLRIAGERELSVPPLSLPTEREARGLPPAALLEYPAIRLFVERAQAVKPDFALSETIAPAVAAICQKLDGLPLAIELAAARARVLPPEQLLVRLDKRLKVLTGGNRDLPPRQQTMRAAIEWSYDLLEPEEKTLFALLAVFSGGCTFEVAEIVFDTVGDLSLNLLDGFDSLTQKSLLRVQDGANNVTRFTMLETIREFGLEQLEATGDADTARRAHADTYMALAEEAEPQLTRPDQITWLNQLDVEHDNFRSAIGWLEQEGEIETRLRIVAALWRFWWMRGHLAEGRRWLDRAIDVADRQPPAVLERALSGAGILAESQGDYEQATLLHENALSLLRLMGDQPGIAFSLTNLGVVADALGDYDRANSLHTEALKIWREVGDELGIASSLNELGTLAVNRGEYETADTFLSESLTLCRNSGDASAVGSVLESLGILAFHREEYERAAQFHQESLAVWRQLRDSRMIAPTLVNHGEVVYRQGDLEQAEASYLEALSIFNELGDKGGAAFALAHLAKVALTRNDVTRATSRFTQSLELRVQVGEKLSIVESLEGLAEVACAQGEAAKGVRLWGATEALRASLGVSLPASYTREREETLIAARTSLGETTFNREWDRGQALSLAQAIIEAHEVNLTLQPGLQQKPR